MALIVEGGTGLSTAESYASIADADAYWTARNDVVWVDLDTEVKEAALRKATDYMVQAYRSSWRGYRKTVAQALDWPRLYCPLPDDYAYSQNWVDDDIVPKEVRNACIELAYRASSATLLPDGERLAIAESVGPLSVTYEAGGPSSTNFTAVDSMLSPYLAGSGSMVKLVRA